MWSAASFQLFNIKIFSPHFLLIECLLTMCFVLEIMASIECHQFDSGYLGTTNGQYDAKICESASSTCYELYGTKGDSDAIYRAGCDECKPGPDEKCQTCKTEFCNYKLANQIKIDNRHCVNFMRGSDQDEYGSQTVHCAKPVTDCYFMKFGPTFMAGCGKGDPMGSEITTCSIDLCNVPQNVYRMQDAAKRNLDLLPEKPSAGNQQGEGVEPPGESNSGEANAPGKDAGEANADIKNATTSKKKPKFEDDEDFLDNSSDSLSFDWAAWTVLSVPIGICIMR